MYVFGVFPKFCLLSFTLIKICDVESNISILKTKKEKLKSYDNDQCLTLRKTNVDYKELDHGERTIYCHSKICNWIES